MLLERHTDCWPLTSCLCRVHLVLLVQEAPQDLLELMALRDPLAASETLVLLEKRFVVLICSAAVLQTGFPAVVALIFSEKSHLPLYNAA